MGKRHLVFILLLFRPAAAFADLALLLNETTGTGTAVFTSAGHSAVYLSNICMASPVRLRLCNPGENGSVISTTAGFGENQPYEWNVSPLNVYLYGVEDLDNVPLYANEEMRRLLQETYRRKYLVSVCPDQHCGTSFLYGRWRDMVGNTFIRDIYAFRVLTTPEQDVSIVELYNSMPNVFRYNGFTHNCADFARSVVNHYFPNAAKPDHLNDFGMTSPKAIAKSFTHYGQKRPELMFYVENFPSWPVPSNAARIAGRGRKSAFA